MSSAIPGFKEGSMSKLKVIILLLLPLLRTAAELLAMKDENTTGVDDEAADAIKYALNKLEKYQQSS